MRAGTRFPLRIREGLIKLMGWHDRERSFAGEVITVVGVKAVLLFVLWLMFFASSPAPTAAGVAGAVLGSFDGTGGRDGERP